MASSHLVVIWLDQHRLQHRDLAPWQATQAADVLSLKLLAKTLVILPKQRNKRLTVLSCLVFRRSPRVPAPDQCFFLLSLWIGGKLPVKSEAESTRKWKESDSSNGLSDDGAFAFPMSTYGMLLPKKTLKPNSLSFALHLFILLICSLQIILLQSPYEIIMASQVAPVVKNLPAKAET